MRLNYRRRKRRRSPARVLVALLLFGTGLAFGTGAESARMAPESFYDELHGWRAIGGRAEETNDGGRTWVTLVGGGEIYAVLRTGLRAGLFVDDSGVYWTNGRGGFYRSRQISPLAVGAGSFLFWWRGDALYRVTPWPFPHDCVAATNREECVYDDSKNRRRVARFTPRVELRFPGVAIGEAATVPAGLVAVSAESRNPENPPRPFVATARWIGKGGAKRVVAQYLPTRQTPLTPCYGTLGVNWPWMVVSACTVVPGNHSPEHVGVWRSVNGGRDWELYSSVS